MSFHAYDPLRTDIGMVNYRTVPLTWRLNYVVVSSSGEVALGDSSWIDVDFFRPDNKAELPKGAYTAGVMVESTDQPFDGVIEITQGGGVVKQCPVTTGSVTCYGYAVVSGAAIGHFRIGLKRRDGGRIASHPTLVKKIIVDVPL